MESKVLTIMFTDIKGFTEKASSASREDLANLLKKHEELLYPVISRFSGTIVKTIGDALLVTFESATNAVLCGILMQEKLREFNSKVGEQERILVRVAINTGEVEMIKNDVFGEAVNLASRLEGITEPNEVYFTESTYLAMNRAEVPSSEIGFRLFRGIPEQIKVFRVLVDSQSADYRSLITRLDSGEGKPGSSSRSPILIAFAVILLSVVCFGFWYRNFAETPDLYYRQMQEALEKDDIELAMKKVEELSVKFPGIDLPNRGISAIVEKEVQIALRRNAPEEAYELLQKREEMYSFLKAEDLERTILLAWAGMLLTPPNANYRGATQIYDRLKKQFPEGEKALEVHRHIVRYLGADFQTGPTGDAVFSAFSIAQKTQGDLDDTVGKTLFLGSAKENPYSEGTAQTRALLSQRYPPAVEAFRKSISSEIPEERLNAFIFLDSAGKLTEPERFGFHAGNLFFLDTNGFPEQNPLEKSVAWLEEKLKGADFQQLKETFKLLPPAAPKSLQEVSELHNRICSVIADGFFEEVKDVIPTWASQTASLALRYNAYQILWKAKKPESIDLWEFHKLLLGGFEPQSDFEAYRLLCRNGVAYFREQESGPRGKEARAVLEGALVLFTSLEARKNPKEWEYLNGVLKETVELTRFAIEKSGPPK